MAVFVLLLFPLCAAASDQHVTVHPGDDVILPCWAGDVSIRAVEWTRDDLESEYVLFYRDGHLERKQQHPSFTGRVELVDRELKDGDVSLILKNVSSRDSGTYECRVAAGGSRRRKRAIIDADPITVIYLEVTGLKTEKLIAGNTENKNSVAGNTENKNSVAGNTENKNSVDGNFPHGRVGLAAGSGVVAVLLLAAAVFAVWKHKRSMIKRSERSAADTVVDDGTCHIPFVT